MALINCPDCHKEISAQAKTCPDCGRPVRSENLLQKDLGMDGWFFGMITIAGFLVALTLTPWGWPVFGIGVILILIKLLK